jgi:malto-oligosyltrehalose trehalohydrolase
VHAITEPGEVSMLHDLSHAVGDLASKTGRHIHLVLENDDNCASLLDADQDPPQGKYRAQWNDDYHHAWHVLLTGEGHGYYSDYANAPLRDIARALESGFVYQGDASAHRGGQLRGEPSGALAPTAFVNFLQNHDQIGNRALGDRIESLAEDRAIEAALAITLLAPMIPMLFMGEEWGSTAPFPFFCDFQDELADAVRKGRRKEFAGAYAKYGDEVPDPLDQTTSRSAGLDWNARDLPKAHRRLTLVRDLLSIRHREIVPRLADARFGDASAEDNGLLSASWRIGDGTSLQLWANLSDQVVNFQTKITGTKIWGGDLSDVISPWAVHWHIGQS